MDDCNEFIVRQRVVIDFQLSGNKIRPFTLFVKVIFWAISKDTSGFKNADVH